jgi:hypothetical protein
MSVESLPADSAHLDMTTETTSDNATSAARDVVIKPKARIVNSDSDSDSDLSFMPLYTAYTNQKTAYTNTKMSSNLATVEHPITKHCPILTAGEIMPKALVDLTNAHTEYFIAKDIDDADKVKKVLGGFKCIHICD